MNTMKWTFCQIWNTSLEEGKSNRVLTPREKIWASELGGSYIDRYLKMKGIEPSNPPNPRSLRKFEAGNIWEAIVGYVLKRAGILLEQQTWLQYQYPGLLPVSGKLDYLAGGKPDYDKALATISNEFTWLPEFISRATRNIIIKLKEQYPDGMEKIVLEVKSCSSFMYERYEVKNDGNPQHKLQDFHYLKAKTYPEGHIVYINKDDARMLEIGVFNPSSTEDEYRKDIELMTDFIMNNREPPKQKELVYELGNFSVNWKVSYSNYLTKLYGYENQKEVEDKFKPIAERWNRVLGRITEGKEMTDNNKEALDEMEKYGFNMAEIKEDAQKEKK